MNGRSRVGIAALSAPGALLLACASPDTGSVATDVTDAAPDGATRISDASPNPADGRRPNHVADAGTRVSDARSVPPASDDAATTSDGSLSITDARAGEWCEPGRDDAAAPTVVSARLLNPESIEVSFSEPVQLSASPDLAEFRLSYAMRTNAEGLLITVYQPLGTWMGPDGGAPEFPFGSVSVPGACGATVTLRLERSLAPAEVCAALDRLAVGADPGTAGLYLHVGEGTHLEDGAHRAVVPVAPEFVPPGDGGPLPEKFVVHEYDPAPPLAAVRVEVACDTANAKADH